MKPSLTKGSFNDHTHAPVFPVALQFSHERYEKAKRKLYWQFVLEKDEQKHRLRLESEFQNIRTNCEVLGADRKISSPN